jgi:hypothetical protein
MTRVQGEPRRAENASFISSPKAERWTQWRVTGRAGQNPST